MDVRFLVDPYHDSTVAVVQRMGQLKRSANESLRLVPDKLSKEVSSSSSTSHKGFLESSIFFDLFIIQTAYQTRTLAPSDWEAPLYT